MRIKPDLVVLDIGLPEMDGLEVCRTVRMIICPSRFHPVNWWHV
jgi:DNA-binding response OmpR family regulator